MQLKIFKRKKRKVQKNQKNKKSIRNRRRLKRKTVILFVSACVVITAACGGYFVWNVYQETGVFDKNKLLSSQPSSMVDTQGNTIYTYSDDENGQRVNIEYDDLPQVLIDAVVATEDARFFENGGYDLPRIVKAFLTNIVKGRISSGGSTITQQLIKKSYYPDEEQTYSRKIGEIILATKATKELSKEEILVSYLNKIYFGRSTQSIGIQAASYYYFNKDVSKLTLPEASMLAGTLNAPSSYDPYYNLSAATSRRKTVLSLMVRHGYITQEEADSADAVSIKSLLNKGSIGNGYKEQNKDYLTLVNNEVYELTGLNPKTTQMVIHTFLDSDIQEYCYKISQGKVVSFPDSSMQVGAAVQESTTGHIVAVIGGRNTKLFGTDRAENKQQPGSSLKPILDYGAAFEYLGWDTDHLVKDETYTKGTNGWNPKNYDGKTRGMITIKEALLKSWNLPAIWTFDEVISKVGYDKIFEMMENFGISMENEEKTMTLAIGGWTYGTSPIELANAYSTIASNGVNIKAHAIDYIEIAKTGEIIDIDEMYQEQAVQAVSAETAQKIKSVMLSYAGEGNYAKIKNLSGTAAKTGTTNDSKDIWMTSYNSSYSVSVWTGYDKHQKTMAGKSGYGHNILYYLSKYALEHGG